MASGLVATTWTRGAAVLGYGVGSASGNLFWGKQIPAVATFVDAGVGVAAVLIGFGGPLVIAVLSGGRRRRAAATRPGR
ncbi:predicted protein [Streptomyces sp. AA4]|nr:predicted protein [Streptomyces sp. AA4]